MPPGPRPEASTVDAEPCPAVPLNNPVPLRRAPTRTTARGTEPPSPPPRPSRRPQKFRRFSTATDPQIFFTCDDAALVTFIGRANQPGSRWVADWPAPSAAFPSTNPRTEPAPSSPYLNASPHSISLQEEQHHPVLHHNSQALLQHKATSKLTGHPPTSDHWSFTA
jgi:hypothetical protein